MNVNSRPATPLSVERTRKVIDECILGFLLEYLRHDEGSSSSSGPSPPSSPQVLTAKDGKRSQTLNRLDSERANNSPTSMDIPPIHLSGRPITIGDEDYRSVTRRSPSMVHSAPYSRSSPGSFFADHMEARDKDMTGRQRRDIPVYHPVASFSSDIHEGRSTRTERHAAKSLFKKLDDHIVTSFGTFESMNSSFSTLRPSMVPRASSEGARRAPLPQIEIHGNDGDQLSELDAKTLLLGDFAENGSWWTGSRPEFKSPDKLRSHRGDALTSNPDIVTLKSPRIDWADVNEWYCIVLNAGDSWRQQFDRLVSSQHYRPRSEQELAVIQEQISEAQYYTQRILLKATESLLKRPGRPLSEPNDLRFLLIILQNPLLYPSNTALTTTERNRSRSRSPDKINPPRSDSLDIPRSTANRVLRSPQIINTSKGSSGQHSGILKRILGLLSNVPNECHHHLMSWFSRYPDGQFQRTCDMISSFVTYRLTRQHGKKREIEQDPTAGLIPSFNGRSTSAALHHALGVSHQAAKKSDGKPKPVVYNDDWQIKAAARVMAILFSANNSGIVRRGESSILPALEIGHSAGLAARERAHKHGQIVPTSDFYNILLDYSDLIADFEAWESKRAKFTFCQYPFFLSIWAKIQIMEHDARRQMEVKAREAFFDSIMTRKNVNQYLVLRVRRDCLVEDSLKSVSEVVGSGTEDIKKGLRIEFKGEEGIDAGGLRKEWFLLLVRDVFNPEHSECYFISYGILALTFNRHVYV
jgi:E3 ubiquitin-protein ligase HECTD2